jgi:hypothetical protein
MTEILLVILTIACLVQIVLVGFLLWYLKRVADTMGAMRGPVPPPPPPPPQLPLQPAAAPVQVPETVEAPEAVVAEKAGPATAAAAAVPRLDVLKESPDIQGSVHRLREKYELADFIITTMDGLVVISLYPGSSDEAARSSDLYRRKKKPDSPNVTFLEIAHRGEAMLGIVRSGHPLSPEERKGIDEDARKILDWWL